MLYSYAWLTVEQLRAVRRLEEELGRTVVAFQGQDIGFCSLTSEQLERIKQEEESLGVVLVAVEAGAEASRSEGSPHG